MNKSRRKRIERAKEQLEIIYNELSEIKDEEQDAYDNLPEGIMLSERGDEMVDYIDALESSMEGVDDAISSLDNF